MKNPVSRSVGRPREFDEGEVLDSAMGVFWRQGYESTSLADLLAATGLHKGSLYQAFGDKRSLFIMALQRYVDGMRSDMGQVMAEAESGLQGLRNALYKTIEMSCDCDHGNPGCLALNTLVEKGIEDEEILAVLNGAYAGRMGLITQTVARAQDEGSIRKDWSADRIANMISIVAAGIAVSLKGPMDEQGSRTLIDDLLATLA